MALQCGDICAGCRILGHCGQGTYGSVYLVEDAIGRRVALKILESPLAGEREIQGLRNFMRLPGHSEALLEIYHIGRENGQFYYLMELADDATGGTGEYQPDTLARRLKARKRLPLDESVTLCLSLLDGLEAMHRVKLLHRDIKPENILFVRGRPKLGDPGLVGDFSHTLSLAGTVGYIPPELLQPNSTAKPSPGSDLYALGKVLYCMVTGNAPQDFPSLPTDMEMATLLRVCAPLSDLCNAIPRKRCGDCGEARRKLLSIMVHHSPLWLVWQRFLNDSLWRRHLLSMLRLGLATLVLVNTLFFVEHSRRQTRLRNEARALLAQRDSLAVRLRQWQRHQLSLAFQLSILGEKFPLVGRLAFADRLLAWNDLRAVRKILDGVDEALPRIAQAHLPPVAAPEGAPPAERLRVNAHAFGYLASPLCDLLPTSVRDGFRDAARREAESLVKHG